MRLPLGIPLILLGTILAGCLASPDPEDHPPTWSDTGGDDAPDGDAVEKVPHAQRHHVHDYWNGATSVTLLDETVPVMIAHNHLFDEPPREQHTHGCDETLVSGSQGGSRKFSLPAGQIVLPGTEALDLLVDWSTPTVTGLRLLYRPANQHDLVDAGAVARGRRLVIPLTVEMADTGHATRTGWVFFLCADGNAPASLAEGEVHVNLMALRAAELPLEPPHPDWWRDAQALELVNFTAAARGVSALNKGEDSWIHVPIEHGRIVPPETQRIRVDVTLENASPAGGLLPVQPMLYYRDATVPEWTYKTAGWNGTAFHVEVDPSMVDGVYARESNWDFWLRLGSRNPQQTPAGSMSHPRHYEGTVTVRITVERGLVPP